MIQNTILFQVEFIKILSSSLNLAVLAAFAALIALRSLF